MNTSSVSPGYGTPPSFTDLCGSINGYFLQSSYVTESVRACSTSPVGRLSQCPALQVRPIYALSRLYLGSIHPL